jgi:hypothetical protein
MLLTEVRLCRAAGPALRAPIASVSLPGPVLDGYQ